MNASELDYELPPELVAQQPREPRESARLLVYRRASGLVEHRIVAELPALLAADTLAVVNDTRVVAARIPLARPRGEVLLLEQTGQGEWEALARPSRRLRAGRRYGPLQLLEYLGEGRWRVLLEGAPAGEVPLPPYITKPLADPERYQTVYGRVEGSAAAPTAGLHLSQRLFERLAPERVTLHVGLDTFRPLAEERLEEHRMHGERYAVSAAAWRSEERRVGKEC